MSIKYYNSLILMSVLNIFTLIWHSQNRQAKAMYLSLREQIEERAGQNNSTMLHIAANSNNLQMVHFLLEEHQKLRMQMPDKFNEISKINWINAKDRDGFTCLHYTVFRGNLKMAKIFEENGADIYQVNNQGLTVIHIAAQGGHPLLLYYFLTKGFKIDVLDSKGNTPLHWACFSGKQNSALALIAWGAQIQKRQHDYGMTSLHLAALSGNTKIVKKLLFCGVDKNLINFNGKRPYDLALQSQHSAVADIIQDKQWSKELLNFKIPYKKTRKYYFPFFLFLLLLSSCHILNIVSFIVCYNQINRKQLYFIYFLLGVLHGVAIIKVITSNPGILNNKNDKHRGMLQMLIRHQPNQICYDCGIVKPDRSRHCQVCQSCIMVYDHHCPWIANCIGAQNYFIFNLFILLTLLLLAFSFCFSISNLINQNWKSLNSNAILRIFTAFYCLSITLVFIAPLIILAVQQAKNASENTTTFQRYINANNSSRLRTSSKTTQLNEELRSDQVQHPSMSMSVSRRTSMKSLSLYNVNKYQNCLSMCWKNKYATKYKLAV